MSVRSPTTGGHPRALERALSIVLRVGVWTSSAMALAAGAAYLRAHGSERADLSSFGGEPHGLDSAGAVARGAGAWDPAAWMQLAVLVLVAAPVVCVGLALLHYLRRRDWVFVGACVVVLAGLGAGMAGLID